MAEHTPEQHLREHGVSPTAVRLLVWETICHESEVFSLHDVERWMPTMDRSSIFRTLKLFERHLLLHAIDDGSGQQKYCLCRCEKQGHVNHIHFYCQKCGKTYCLEDYIIPVVRLPDGFLVRDVEYVVKGICSKCSTL